MIPFLVLELALEGIPLLPRLLVPIFGRGSPLLPPGGGLVLLLLLFLLGRQLVIDLGREVARLGHAVLVGVVLARVARIMVLGAVVAGAQQRAAMEGDGGCTRAEGRRSVIHKVDLLLG